MTEINWVEQLPEAQRERMGRGEHPMDPRRLGSSIAVVGGVVFVAANAPALGAPMRRLLLLAAVALAAWLCGGCSCDPAASALRRHRTGSPG